jgi:hypothetical protein
MVVLGSATSLSSARLVEDRNDRVTFASGTAASSGLSTQASPARIEYALQVIPDCRRKSSSGDSVVKQGYVTCCVVDVDSTSIR